MITSLKNRIIQIRIIIFVFTAVILTAIIHIVSYQSSPYLCVNFLGDILINAALFVSTN